MKRFLRRHGLSLVMLGGFFVVFFVGQIFTGHRDYNAARAKHGASTASLGEYLQSGHFAEATAENWESEFLQMFVYVAATAFLYQKGSAESKDPDARHPHHCTQARPDSPWPVRRGGWWLRLYEHSLSLALLTLFLAAFTWHAIGGLRHYNEERAAEGDAAVALSDYLASSRFWFEAFQNWQSEFLSIGAMVLLTIWLREVNSPESKKVETPHGENEE